MTKLKRITPQEYNVIMINSIKDKYKELRQKSKGITFALSYMGTYLTLMENFGFNEYEAKKLEKAYHDLYQVSDAWVKKNLSYAQQFGYVYGAFGLKIRTPQLHRLKGSFSNQWAEKEKRTAANALGQSYGLLNDRAMMGFINYMRVIRKIPKELQEYIKPVAKIHDAQYYLIKDDPRVLKFVNDFLIEQIKWQESPQIKHDLVHLGGDLSVFYPTWANETVVPNDSSQEYINELLINLHKIGEKND